MSFLKIENATKSYGSVEVLHRVDIDVEEGEFLVLVGPSGCGKSTLLNMIAGLEEISSGTISIKNKLMNGVHPSKRNIAMVFQSYALYPNMTVAQNITFGLEMHGIAKEEREKALQRVSEMLQIDALLKRKPGQLSGGQRQRVAMGRALVRNPDVFLFDEPLSNLDAKLRVDMRKEIKRLHQRLGTTIVYVTHDQIEALTLSTRIAVMNGGYIQQLGTPNEIYDSPANLFVASFMGSPSMNLINVTARSDKGKTVIDLTDANGNPVQLAVPKGIDLFNGSQSRDVVLGVRPESISDAESLDHAAKNTVTLPNTIEIIEPAGSDTFVTTTFNNTEVVGRLPSDASVSVGQKFDFALNMDGALFFDPETTNRIG